MRKYIFQILSKFLKIGVGIIISAFLLLQCKAEEVQFCDVFISGECGFKSIRIPSVVVSTKGTILAFAEGRAANADQAQNKIILKRSVDNGNKWGEMQIIADDGRNSLNNPCAVVEKNSGKIILFYQSYPEKLPERSKKLEPGYDGTNIVRSYMIYSDDDGLNWSKPRDLTKTIKNKDATILASGPGIGIQLQKGQYKGRLIMPFNEGHFGKWYVLSVYSDDFGEKWKLGEPAPGSIITDEKNQEISLVNEVQMVELSDGSVMLNSRKWGGRALRKIAISKDGGITWSKITEDPALRDNGCMASIYAYSHNGKYCIMFSHPDSVRRENGTIRISFDDGKTWQIKKVLYKGGFAYSVLTSLPDGTIGCLFEADNYKRIAFAKFSFQWLTESKNE